MVSVTWMDSLEAVFQPGLGFDRLEAENLVEAFVVGGDATRQVQVPCADSRSAERMAEAVPRGHDIVGIHLARSVQ
jgi:hypothetical protein